MSIFLVLDILLLLLIALFMPIGYWRGPVKELFVTLGILFGILLADFWSRPWGRDLSDMTNLTASSGAFIVAMIFLVASTFILGYGLGATLAPAWHLPQTRVLGAVISAINGMLLLSFSLQYVRIFLLSDANEESLHDSFISGFLLDQIGWVLMAAAFFAAPLLLFILFTGQRAYAQVYDDYAYDEYSYTDAPIPPYALERQRTPDAPTNVLPPRMPGAPREQAGAPYKADPQPRRRRPTAETRPLVVSEQRATAEPEYDAQPVEGRMSDTDPHMVMPMAQRPSPRAPRPEPENEEPDNLAPGYTRCVNCHAVLAPDTSICPNCGTVK